MHTVWRTLFHLLWLHLSWLFGNRLLQCIISQTAHPFCNNKIIANLGFAAFSKFHFFAINKPFSDLYGWSFCHFSEFKNIVENIDCRLNCVCKTFINTTQLLFLTSYIIRKLFVHAWLQSLYLLCSLPAGVQMKASSSLENLERDSKIW